MLFLTRNNFPALLADLLPGTQNVVEAGAFTGKDTLALAQRFPQATIHAFEPIREIYTELQKNTQNFPTIKTYSLALSNTNGSATFYRAQNPKRPDAICQAGSLLAPCERLAHSPITYPHTSMVPTITLDSWAADQGITAVDFLWLDLQGHELAVLQASPILMQTVKAVYLEINFIPAYQNQPTAEHIHEWFISQGFSLEGTDYQGKLRHFFGNHLYIKNSV